MWWRHARQRANPLGASGFSSSWSASSTCTTTSGLYLSSFPLKRVSLNTASCVSDALFLVTLKYVSAQWCRIRLFTAPCFSLSVCEHHTSPSTLTYSPNAAVTFCKPIFIREVRRCQRSGWFISVLTTDRRRLPLPVCCLATNLICSRQNWNKWKCNILFRYLHHLWICTTETSFEYLFASECWTDITVWVQSWSSTILYCPQMGQFVEQ